MSTEQATRCPNCATVFRVAAVQLQAYEGWVRCGRCAEVFNAEQCLVALDPPQDLPPPPAYEHAGGPAAAPADFDLQFDLPPVPPSSPAPPMARAGSGLAPAYGAENMVERAVQAMREAPAHPPWSHTMPVHEVDTPRAAAAPEAVVQYRVEALDPASPPLPAAAGPATPSSEAGHRFEPLMAPEAVQPFEHFEPHVSPVAWQPAAEVEEVVPPAQHEPASQTHTEPVLEHPASDGNLVLHASRDAVAEPDALHAQPTPSFVRQADRAARWRSPKVTAAMASLCLTAALGLLAQAAYEYRDLVAARFEPGRPLLERACRLLQCSVSAPRVLDAEGVSVESSGLVRIEKTNTYRLNVALRNRAATVVALPALELSLTDAQGKLMARRVLGAADFGVTQNTVAAGRELSLQATMQTAFASSASAPQEIVAGYTIELFYP
jgi:predicted Zn finger-like uncharacterized protein